MQVGVGVGNGVGEVDVHIFVLEVVFELQVVGDPGPAVATQPLNERDVETPVLAPLGMAGVLVAGEILAGVRSHALAIEVAVLDDVGDVELDGASVLSVAHSEVVPVGVSFGVGVAPHEAVVFVLFYSDGQVQVAALELRAERHFALSLKHLRLLQQLRLLRQLHLLPQKRLPLLFSHLAYRLFDHPDLHLVFLTVFPKIWVAFVQLHGIDVPGTSVNNLEDVAGFHAWDNGIYGGILVGEGDGAGGEFGHPAGSHVGFEGVLLLQYGSALVLFVKAYELHFLLG